MKVFIFGLLVAAASASSLGSEKFQVFKSEHGKIYKNQVEETKRFNIFNANLRDIEEHNALYEDGLVLYKKGVNQFTDWTEEELQAYLKTSTSKKPKLNTSLFAKTGAPVPAFVDWRKDGQVTPVKNQFHCAGAWAFSLSGSTEAAYFRKTGKLISLSEQQLIDCAPKPNEGCEGGFLDDSFPYLEEAGFQSEESYPYIGNTSECMYNKSKVITNVTDYFEIPTSDENALLEVVGTIGPASIMLQAKYLFPYTHGIYIEPQCDPYNRDHSVLAVGYGSENGVDYWIIKNSFGQKWGENGYFRIRRGTNECGLSEDGVLPIIK